MLSFFRRTRKKQIKENRFTRYLIYALGEIFLVVVGILIALQINTWNAQRLDRNTEKELLTDLLENLEINRIQLEEDLEWDSLSMNSGNIILEHIEKQLPYSEDLKMHFQNSRLVPQPFLSSGTYKSIENKGFEIISSKELRKSIIRLFDDVYPSMILDLQTIDQTIMKPSLQEYMLQHFEYDKDRNILANDYEALIRDQEYENILSFNVFIINYFSLQRKTCLEEIKLLEDQIERELKKF